MEEKNLIGVRGWLLVLCIILTILTPLSFFIQGLGQIDSSYWYGTPIALFAFASGLLLWIKHKAGVKVARAYFWTSIAIVVLAIILRTVNPAFGLGSIIGLAIWLLYLYLSKRVKATYGQ